MFTEKRKFPRANIKRKISTVFGERILVFNSHTENIGEGGVRVVLEDKLYVPAEVDLELFLYDSEIPVKCKAQLAWVREIEPAERKPSLFDTGIKFTEINNSDRECIGKLVKTLVAQGEGA